jgi:hypothetical protein
MDIIVGGGDEEEKRSVLDWFKHNIFTSKKPKQNPHWTMNRHLNNEGQECKTGHVKGRTLVEGGR